MAGIDKTYTAKWEEYVALRDWIGAKNIPNMEDSLYEWEEQDFDRITYTLPVLNTPEWADIYLAKHCPLEFVKARLIDVYPQQWVRRYMGRVVGKDKPPKYRNPKKGRANAH